jgi:hypothetical protein
MNQDPNIDWKAWADVEPAPDLTDAVLRRLRVSPAPVSRWQRWQSWLESPWAYAGALAATTALLLAVVLAPPPRATPHEGPMPSLLLAYNTFAGGSR